MAGAELEPKAIKTDRVISRIEHGDIKIPAFQRGFVWTQEQVIALLDSIYNNYPIGSVLLWTSNERLNATRNVAGFKIPDREPDYPVNYVLDGQQRLSTIYGVFCTDRTQAQQDPTYAVDASLFDISFLFESELFLPTASVEDPAGAIELKVLFNTDSLFEAMESLSSDHRKAARDLHSKFNNYELPVVAISKREKSEVGTIFERINNTGTKLSTLDLMIAWTWSEDFHLQAAINELLQSLEEKGFGDLTERILLQSLSGILRNSTKTKVILSLPPEEVREHFEELTASLERTIDFLSTTLAVASRELLPHLQQVVPLAYFFYRQKSPSVTQAHKMRQWFWNTSFSRRYSSQTDDKMDEDIRLMGNILANKEIALSRYRYTADTRSLIRQPLTKTSPAARAFLLLLAQRKPRDLVNGVAVDTGHALSSFNRKEYHHIFPRAFLKGRGLEADTINSLCNFCFLPAASNKIISRRPPSDYIFQLVREADRKDILESNLMPLKMDLYERNDYDEFLENRAQLALSFLDSLIA